MSTTTSIHHIEHTSSRTNNLDTCCVFSINALIKDTNHSNDVSFFFDTKEELHAFLREIQDTINNELNTL